MYKAIGETLAESEDLLIGRIFEITQQEFDGDFTKLHVKLRFRITEVVGSDAITSFMTNSCVKFDATTSFIGSLMNNLTSFV